MWLVRIVGTVLCTQMVGLGLISAWVCMIAHNLFLFLLFMNCYRKGDWDPLAAEDETVRAENAIKPADI